MPRWTFELNPGSLSRSEKDTIAKQITSIYTEFIGFPTFWTNVFFHENPDGCAYFGGEVSQKHAFLIINHAARSFKSEEERLGFIDRVDAILRPIFEPKGIDWEFNIYEHPSTNWRINGMIPPVTKPDVLKQWIEQNRPVPY